MDEAREEIRRTAQRFAREHVPVSRLRALRDARDPLGYAREAWKALGRLGLVGLAVPEAFGGAGLGLGELAAVIEEHGRTLAPLPWISTAVIGASALVDGGSEAQKRAHLPALCAGERLFAFAHDEGTRHTRDRLSTRAERAPGGFVLRGEKTLVLDGHVADQLIVSVEGPTLFLVPANAPGVTIERLHLVDSRNAARIRLDGVAVGDADALGRPGQHPELIDRLLDRAQVALAAEMLGGALEVFEQTIAYLRTRKQFGVPIGSFQALKHRAAWLHVELELLRSVVDEAATSADDPQRADLPLLACAAKARAADAFLHAAAEAIQMHGGIGVTDELDVGLFYKRARVAELTFGDSAFQRDRFARLQGY
jgi:acyl-CoA dehydrogenase